MSEREVLDLDVLFVGAGPASLAGAIHLKRLLSKSGTEASVAVLEKASEIGAHSLSGAIVDPRALRELFPDFLDTDLPFEAEVSEEHLYYLTENKKIPFPFVPPSMSHHHCFVTSLGKLTRWLGNKCENEGVDIFCGFAGTKLLYEGEQVVGVRTGDRGIDKNGEKKPQFEPGADIRAKVVILGEGTRGSLTKNLIDRHELMQGCNPQVWAVGVKELWQMPSGTVPPGYVAHTMGFPLGQAIFGGAFLYGMQNDIWDLGLVVGLDYQNPGVDSHHELQRLKNHPWIRSLLSAGKMIAYGAKSLPEGGWYSIPKLSVGGAMLIGDSAGFMNGQRLKGIHLAMKSGMLAAETTAEALATGKFSESDLADYDSRIASSWIRDELWKVRNFHQGFDRGLFGGLANAGIGLFTGGRGWGIKNRLSSEAGHKKMQKGVKKNRYQDLQFDGTYLFDKVTDVYYSATAHEEDQVPHLKIRDQDVCVSKCTEEYGNPCEKFCPANVYEMLPDGDGQRLQINFSNCVHCKTCDIMDPYQIIDWVPPEGGDGPVWVNL
ncbi:MAG TPA: electron transfer flavoprotein-ubiquinone oxidoreductase [Nitrospinaceae bacterium]|jgi:electron-transferring-flavoprotein dehydrogenase|nr:electron transfer flavoprotein-ubiquinone oxidoreductase [Nitrospinaceae bacterium]